MGRIKDMFIAEAEAAQYLSTTPEPLFFKYIGFVRIRHQMHAVHANTVNDAVNKVIKMMYESTGEAVEIIFNTSEQDSMDFNVTGINPETHETSETTLQIYHIHKHLTT